NEDAVRVELEKLGRGGAEGIGNSAAARVDEDVSLGVHRHAGCFAEVHVGRKLEQVGDGIELQFCRLLCERRWGGQQHQSDEPFSHMNLPACGGVIGWSSIFAAAAGVY